MIKEKGLTSAFVKCVAPTPMVYFLWNKGATLVDSGTLAIMNNALVPAGLVVNLVLWNRDADLLRFSLGGSVLLLSLLLHEFWGKSGVREGSSA